MRILLVEDHADTMDAFSRILRRNGHEVLQSFNAFDAERICDEQPLDVMLCDLMLPDRDGWSLAGVAKKKGIPAIAISALAQRSDINHSREAGFAAHLTKPLNMQVLTQMLNELIRRRAAGADSEGKAAPVDR